MRLIVSGGGTGGHLFPGIALADAVLNSMPGSDVLFVGTGRYTEQRVLNNGRFETAKVKCRGIKGKSVFQKIFSLVQLPAAVYESAKIIKKFQPQLVLGVGGYVTGPVLLAAKLMGIATCIHEQNSVPGMANRRLGAFVDKVFLSIPGSEQFFEREKCILTGNPVRQELITKATCPRKPADEKILLVLGGSLGAHRVNTLMLGAMEKIMAATGGSFRIIHQTGVADEDAVRNRYIELGVQADVSAFYDDMATVYHRADLVVARAGATSIAELTIFKLPMILIPYPYAADNHQQKNGEYLAKSGAAKLFIEKEVTEAQLADEITLLLRSEKKRQEMSESAGQYARPEATKNILRECMKLLDEKKKKKNN